MWQERLQEIAVNIINIEDPLALGVYLTTLGNDDIRSFLSFIKNDKYKDMNLYTAIISFSYDYLKSIGYAFPDNKAEKFAFVGKKK